MNVIRSVSLLAGLACALTLYAANIPAKGMFGEARVAIIENSSAVTAELVSTKIMPSAAGSLHYSITSNSAPRELSRSTIATLRKAVLKDWYDNGSRKACTPLPGMRYVFRYKSESVSLLVCYSCKHLIVEEDGNAVAGRPAEDIMVLLREVAASFLTEQELEKLR